MSKIKSQDTKPELFMKPILEEYGFVYQEFIGVPGVRTLIKADFVNRETKTVIFIHGCFWHKCPKHFRMPKSNRRYWKEKFRKNVERDREIARLLAEHGWTVAVIWEHDVKELMKIREIDEIGMVHELEHICSGVAFIKGGALSDKQAEDEKDESYISHV